jgi:hypothetical protein
MREENEVQRALQDLAHIRRAIEGVASAADSQPAKHALPTALLLQLWAFVLCTAILIVEWLSAGINTSMLLASRESEWLRQMGLVNIASVLVLLVFALQVLVRAGARQSEESLSDFIARNFVYLRNFSLASDLVLKFSVFALVIMARVPELTSPLLIIFTADYLFQGRLFVLPFRSAMILGVLLLGIAFLQFSAGSASVSVALLCFSLVSAFSLVRAYLLRRRTS